MSTQIHFTQDHAEEFKSMQSDYAQVVRRRQHNVMNAEMLENEKRTQLETNAKTLDMDTSSHVYKSFGRLYLEMPVPELRDEIKENIKYCDTEADKLREKRTLLDKSAKNYEDKISEFIKKNAIKPDEATESEAKPKEDNEED
uniref:Prefoldin subunit 4 n=1 Tax=Percolomonas cosmopolitus TaxID=63605 RepID=A0A7S1PHJ5_9EUKA|eukprot:CAMPEP_0117448802 /NCGR_PEP_ID=MMETSP0759-20121206/7597_1 /TAXON_ID=63605 /ORGANISM="Percolomonas cosmopolitus, Strain WS" /LENGTH=142 /DNA_ID=CAMNT_0005241217 /DNA_START=18 /DNA_END=446 /DNA_ORIENTATION=+